MNLRTATLFFWACLVGTAAVAGDEQRTRIDIAVQDDEVLFIDGREFDADIATQTHGNHEVRDIRKEVDVTN